MQANVEVLRLFLEESFLKENFYNNTLKSFLEVVLVGSDENREGISIFIEEKSKEIDLFNEKLKIFVLIEKNYIISL